MDRDYNNNSGSEGDGPQEATVNGDVEKNHGSDLSLAAEFSNEVGVNIFRTEINISSTVQKVFNQKSDISSIDFTQKSQVDDTRNTVQERSKVSRGSILKSARAIRNFSTSTYSKDSNIESSISDGEIFVEKPVNVSVDKNVNDAKFFIFPDVSSNEKQNRGKDTNKTVETGVTEVRKDAEKDVSDKTNGLIQINGLGGIENTDRKGSEGNNNKRDKAPVKGKRKKRVAFAEDAEEHDDTTSGAEAASEAAAQSRLAQSHSNIEQLQQNLSTKLRSSTVETLRSELPTASPEVNRRRREAFFFAEGTDPAVWRKSAEEAATEAQTEFQVVVSHSPKPENAVVVSAEIGVKQERANSLTIKDLPLDLKNSVDQPTEEAAVTPSSKSDDNIPYADSFADDEADNDSSPCFSPPVTLNKREESIKDSATIENHKPLPKPQKVSWTTQLIERLSEEKETKRTPPKKPPRLVRYPGQKDFEENGKTVIVKTVATAKPPQPKPRNETVDFDNRRIEDHTINDESEDSDSDAQETERLRQKVKEELKSTTSYIIMPESSSKETQPQLRKAIPERGSVGNKSEPPPPKPKAASGSAFKRLLSPATSLFSSQRGDARRRTQSEDRSQVKTLNFTPLKQQKTPTYYRSSTSAKEDPQSMKPLLSKKNTLSSNHSRVKPISTSPPPMVETAFLSKHTDSPTKQNMYNSSKNKKKEPSIFDDEQQQKKPLPPLPSRSKSLSPARKNAEMASRTIPQTSLIVEERLESIRRSLTPTAAPSPIPNDDNHFVGRRQQRNYQSLPPVPSEPKRTISKVQASPKNVTAENMYVNKEVIQSEKSAVDANKDPKINQNIHIQIPDDMYQHVIPKNAYYHSPPGLRGRNQLGTDASSVSSTSTIVSSVQDIRPHRQDIPSGRVSAPPGASPGWQAAKMTNEYGKPNVLQLQRQRLSDGSPSSNTAAGSPGGEPIYGQQQPKGLEPKRLSRQEIEALYWQTQLLREELAVQRRYLSGRGRQGSSSSLPGHYATPLARPQPVYGSHHRSRSASPGPYHGAGQSQLYAHTRSMSLPRTGSQEVPQDEGNIFVRGAAHRNTIATMRTDQRSTPTIYEEVQQQTTPSEADMSAVLRRRHAKPSLGPNPIFKRGSLQSNSDETDASMPPPTAPKRVSFTPPDQRWPTRSGSAADPPTRQRDSGDSDVFLPNYVNLADVRMAQGMERPYGMLVHTRPLPPTPSSNSTIYGVVLRKPQQVPQYADRWPPNQVPSLANRWQQQQQFHSESESGSEAGEIQRILAKSGNSPRSKQGSPRAMCSHCSDCCRHGSRRSSETGKDNDDDEDDETTTGSDERRGDGGSCCSEEEWGADGKPRGASGDQTGVGGGVGSRDEDLRRGGGGGGGGGGRPGRRDDPRRHTLSGADHHQHHSGPGGVLARSMDLEMSSKSQRRKSPLPRGYPPLPSTAMLFDDDPGIMSEVETSSTGFRRGGKQRSSLPVVRTPSKTLERPLGLVFLQYRSETKRALLPNEITSIDTVKALFVRSFPKQLTMEYLDSPHVKIYIHDSSKDMFYELEDLRSHLRDIRDRSVLRLFESTDMNGGVLPGAGVGVAAPPIWDQDQSYFSEPEFDSEYQHQHIHKSKASSKSSATAPYYMTHSYPPGSTAATAATLPRGGPLLRAYSPAVVGPKQTGAPPKPIRTYQHHIGAPLLLGKGAPSSSAVSASVTGSTNVIAPPVPERLFRPFTIHSSTATTTTEHREMGLYSTPDRLHSESGYMSSPERGGPRAYPSPYSAGGPGAYEDPYYSQYAPRSGSITPVIDEEASDTELLDESYSLYGVKLQPRPGAPPPRGQFPPPASVVPYDATRIRVEHMERQLANLTGLVQKALTQTPQVQQTPSATPREYLQVPPGSAPTTPGSGSGRDTTGYRNAADEYDKHSSSSSASLPDDSYLRSDTKPPKLGKDKSVSFEKSVSFSDEPPDMNSPKQHSPQHTADSKPTKPAIKSSTLPRMSSQERDRHKPAPPPKPVSLSPGQYEGRHVYRADLQLTPEMYNQLRGLQKKAKDLRQEVRNLRRMSQAQAHSVRETIRDTFIKIRAMLLTGGDDAWSSVGDSDKLRLSREEDLYKQEMLRLEKDLTELESTVEELRGNVINRKTRVNMSDVENMALILSKSSKTVADLKVRFPSLQEGMKSLLSSEMEKVVREEKFLKEEPERLESALRRCKKLTGTLVTLKRLASVQEQRLPPSTTPDSRLSPTLGGGGGGDSDTPITPPAHGKANTIPARSIMASTTYSGGRDDDTISRQRPENALDALLDELQTFARPPPPGNPNTSTTSTSTLGEIGRKGSVDSGTAVTASGMTAGSTSSLRRLHSYPSSSDCGSSSSSPPAPQLSRLQVSGDLGNQKPPQISPKPPVPERNAELLSQLSSGRRVPPPPPPRTSSRSPLASPTSPSLPPRGQTGSSTLLRRGAPGRSSLREPLRGSGGLLSVAPSDAEELQIQGTFNPASNSSSCESVNSQEGIQQQNPQQQRGRKELLEQRHQELLRKQRALQEQYARLQQLQRGTATAGLVIPAGNSNTLIPANTTPDLLMLKKTGSESNLLAKMGLGAGLVATMSGSLTSLAPPVPQPRTSVALQQVSQGTQITTGDEVNTTGTSTTTTATTTTSKIYETDIL